MTSAAAIPDCLATTVCPNCGYSLMGLGQSGVCPECARPYDQSQIILYGWGRGQHESVATAKKSRIVWVVFLSMLWMVFQFQYFLFSVHGTRNVLVVFALFAAVVAYSIFGRSETSHPGQIQIRLSEAGVVQYDNLCGPSILQQLIHTRGYWIPLIGTAALCVSYWRGWIGALNFWLYFPLAAAFAAAGWITSRRTRRELDKLPDNAIADANAAYLKPTPWAKLSGDFLLRPTKGGSYRLRMENVTRLITRYPIDAEIQCTAEQAAELEKYLSAKIKSARPPDPRLAEAIYQWKQHQGTKPHCRAP